MVAPLKKPELTRSTEDYLKAIFELQSGGSPAATRAIAEMLAVAPPSVTGMVRRLAQSGLLEHTPYRGVRLTQRGTQAALRILRRHRVLESYLSAKLGYAWDSVHGEAERLEHAASDELIERMAMALGNPRRDPHGAPIPTPAGEMEREELAPLAEVPEGELAEIRQVSDRDAEMLRYLAFLGLKPGVTVEVGARQPFQGPLTLRVLSMTPREVVIGRELASVLYCEVKPKEAG